MPQCHLAEFSEQLEDRFALHNVMRSAEPVGDVRLGAIAERMVDGGDKVRDVDRVVVERKGSPRLPGANRVERELLEPFEVAFRRGGGWPLALGTFEQAGSAGLALCVNARGSGEAGHRLAGPPGFVEKEKRIEAR